MAGKRQRLHHRTDANRLGGHPVDHRRGTILRDRVTTALADAQEPFRAVITHAGENHTQRVAAIHPRHRFKKHCSRGPLRGDWLTAVGPDGAIFHHPQMMILNRDIDLSGEKHRAIFDNFHGERTDSGESHDTNASRKLPVICCTSRIGSGNAVPRPPSNWTSAPGPPVELAIPSARNPRARATAILPSGAAARFSAHRRTTFTPLIIASCVQRRSASAV